MWSVNDVECEWGSVRGKAHGVREEFCEVQKMRGSKAWPRRSVSDALDVSISRPNSTGW